MITERSIVVVSNGQVSGELEDGDVAILHLKNGVYYGLDQVGGRIWSLIQQPRQVGEIRDILLEEYEVDQETCTRDLLAILEELHQHDLVEIRNGPG